MWASSGSQQAWVESMQKMSLISHHHCYCVITCIYFFITFPKTLIPQSFYSFKNIALALISFM